MLPRPGARMLLTCRQRTGAASSLRWSRSLRFSRSSSSTAQQRVRRRLPRCSGSSRPASTRCTAETPTFVAMQTGPASAGGSGVGSRAARRLAAASRVAAIAPARSAARAPASSRPAAAPLASVALLKPNGFAMPGARSRAHRCRCLRSEFGWSCEPAAQYLPGHTSACFLVEGALQSTVGWVVVVVVVPSVVCSTGSYAVAADGAAAAAAITRGPASVPVMLRILLLPLDDRGAFASFMLARDRAR